MLRNSMQGLILIILSISFIQCSGGSMKDFIDQKTKTNFSQIMKSYPGLKELKNEDLKLKGDGYYSYEVQDKDKKLSRANVILEVFPKLTKKGMDLSEFITRLKTYAWIKKENFDVIEDLGGKLPIKFVNGNTHAVIRFADSTMQGISLTFPTTLASALYFRISGVTNKDELFSYIKDYPAGDISIPHKLRGLKVVEAALFMEIDVKDNKLIK